MDITEINTLNQEGVENLQATLRACGELETQAGRLRHLGLGIGDHIEQCLGDGQVVALVAQVVVRADQAQSTLVDARRYPPIPRISGG